MCIGVPANRLNRRWPAVPSLSMRSTLSSPTPCITPPSMTTSSVLPSSPAPNPSRLLLIGSGREARGNTTFKCPRKTTMKCGRTSPEQRDQNPVKKNRFERLGQKWGEQAKATCQERSDTLAHVFPLTDKAVPLAGWQLKGVGLSNGTRQTQRNTLSYESLPSAEHTNCAMFQGPPYTNHSQLKCNDWQINRHGNYNSGHHNITIEVGQTPLQKSTRSSS